MTDSAFKENKYTNNELNTYRKYNQKHLLFPVTTLHYQGFVYTSITDLLSPLLGAGKASDRR